MTKIKVSGNNDHGPRLSLSRPTKSPLVTLLIGCDRSSAHGAVLVTPAVHELRRAILVNDLPTAREPCDPLPEPRQRLKTDRADLSLLLFLVIVHRAGGRGGALRLSLGHQAGRVLVRGGGPICVALRNPNPEMVKYLVVHTTPSKNFGEKSVS